jgi:hypothetical protein
VARPKSSAVPVVNFSLFAPLQNDSPVHIVGIEHDRREIGFVLSNTSDKAVESVGIVYQMIPPLGCAVKPLGPLRTGLGGGPVLIPPHGRAFLSQAIVHYPKMMMYSAKDWGAPYIQAQLGIRGVNFADGTTWPTPADNGLSSNPLDKKLVESEAGKCFGAPNVAAELDAIQEIVFDHESPQPPDQDDEKNFPPHLRFSCSLEGPKAICRMPLESDQAAKQPETAGHQ